MWNTSGRLFKGFQSECSHLAVKVSYSFVLILSLYLFVYYICFCIREISWEYLKWPMSFLVSLTYDNTFDYIYRLYIHIDGVKHSVNDE